jgi:hypothetical protein
MNIFCRLCRAVYPGCRNPRPHAREVLLKLADEGHSVYLWSTAGEGYAAEAARVLGVEDALRGCCLKHHPPEGITVDYAVDDDEGVVEEYGGFLVRPYAGDPWDSELLGVLDAIPTLGPS